MKRAPLALALAWLFAAGSAVATPTPPTPAAPVATSPAAATAKGSAPAVTPGPLTTTPAPAAETSVATAKPAAPPAKPPAPPAKTPSWLRPDKPAAKAALVTRAGPTPLRIGLMLFVVASLGGVAFYARRKKRITGASVPSAAPRVLGQTRVGAKATAVVIEVAGKRLLLGVTDQAVSTLAWLDDEANAAADERRESSAVTPRSLTQPDDVAAAGPSGFLRLLRNAVGSGAARPAAAAAVDEVASATRDQVRLSHRAFDADLPVEGQVRGLSRRRSESS